MTPTPQTPPSRQRFSRRACPARPATTATIAALALFCALSPAPAQIPGAPGAPDRFTPLGAPMGAAPEPAPTTLPAPNPNTVYREVRLRFPSTAAANAQTAPNQTPAINALAQSLLYTFSNDTTAAPELYARLKHIPLVAAPQDVHYFNVNAVQVPTDDPAGMTFQFALTPTTNPPLLPPDQCADALADLAKDRALADWTDAKQSTEQSASAAEQKARDAAAALDQHRHEIDRLRQKLADTTHRTDLSPTAIRTAIDALETERQKLDIDVAGMQARHDALAQALAEQTKRTHDAAQTDPVAAELQKVVDIREKQLDTMKQVQETGRATAAEVREATLALAEARARLAERQLAAAGGADTLAALNRELLTLTIDLREKQARLDYVTKQLHAYATATTDADTLQQRLATLPKLQDAAEASAQAAQAAQRALAPFAEPPTLTITNPTTQPTKSPEKT